MIILDATTKSLEVKLTGAVTTTELVWHADAIDYLDSDQSVSDLAETDGLSNGATAVTMVAAPAAAHTRHVRALTVYNQDTAAAVVTIQINNGGTKRIVWKGTLAVGDNLIGN